MYNTPTFLSFEKDENFSTTLVYTFLAVFGISAILAGLAFDKSAAWLVILGGFSLFVIEYVARNAKAGVSTLKTIFADAWLNATELIRWLLMISPETKQNVKHAARLDTLLNFVVRIFIISLIGYIAYNAYLIKSDEGLMFVAIVTTVIYSTMLLVRFLGQSIVSLIRLVQILYQYRSILSKKAISSLASLAFLIKYSLKLTMPILYVAVLGYGLLYEGETGTFIVGSLFIAKFVAVAVHSLLKESFGAQTIVKQMALQTVKDSAYAFPIRRKDDTSDIIYAAHRFNPQYMDQFEETKNQLQSEYGEYAGLALKGVQSNQETISVKQSNKDGLYILKLAS